MVLPGVGSHAIRLEYDVFDCPDTFYDETLDFTAGDWILLAASGRRGTERVTAIDLRGRSDLLASQLLVVNLSSAPGARRMWSMAPVAARGALAFEDVAVVPVAPGVSTSVSVTTTTTLTATSNVSAFGIDMVICILRDDDAGAQALDCTAMGRR